MSVFSFYCLFFVSANIFIFSGRSHILGLSGTAVELVSVFYFSFFFLLPVFR